MNKNNFITVEDYETLKINQLVDEFKVKFNEKIGYKPNVYITKTEEIKLISLSKLEEIVNSFISDDIIKKYKIRSIADHIRKREVSDLRHIFCKIAKNMNYSLTSIGNHLNNRDHTTIINSCKKFQNLIKTDESFKEKYNSIMFIINKSLNGNELLQSVDEEPTESKSTLYTVLL